MRHKKKVKSLHAQLAETRHELSLQMFEMRSEMEQLSEQNSDLKGMKNKTQLSEQSSKLKGMQNETHPSEQNDYFTKYSRKN